MTFFQGILLSAVLGAVASKLFPPLTHDPVFNFLACSGGAFCYIALFQIAKKARAGLWSGFDRVFRAALGLIVAIAVATLLKATGPLAWAILLLSPAIGAATARKRTRYIPRWVRRAVIERDLKGEPFDPKKHHIDHIWPVSRGGSNTIDNLRVIEKTRNLRKGARKPRIRELFAEAAARRKSGNS